MHLKAAAAVDRLTKDTERLRRRVQRRSESLARQFDRVLRVLESWGYVNGWSLTDGGELLSPHLLGGGPARRRGAAHRRPRRRDAGRARGPRVVLHLRAPRARRRAVGAAGGVAHEPGRARRRELRRIWRDLRANEDDAGLPETRAPDAGLADAMHAWASGDALADVLDEDDELTGGDFVRNVKQVVDLLRPDRDVAAPSAGTRATADAAADACFRGVVAASSVVP